MRTNRFFDCPEAREPNGPYESNPDVARGRLQRTVTREAFSRFQSRRAAFQSDVVYQQSDGWLGVKFGGDRFLNKTDETMDRLGSGDPRSRSGFKCLLRYDVKFEYRMGSKRRCSSNVP